MDICITKFQSQHALDVIPALSCLCGLADKCVVEASEFGLRQACAALC